MKTVAIDGGTGLSVLLRGLKEYTDNITAIVTVAEDGGTRSPPPRVETGAPRRPSELPRGPLG